MPSAVRSAPRVELASRLNDGIARLGIDVSAEGRAQLLQYLHLLAKWNAVYNLTSVRDIHDMLAVHLLDALSIVPIVDELAPRSVVDVGSGAGIPAIPLAIARPVLKVRSVDAVAKKVGFQLQVKGELRLANLEPLHRRIEDLQPVPVPDLIVSRAYADLAKMLASVEHLVDEQCRILAMKGVRPEAELSAVPATWVVVATRTLDVPFLGAERCAVLIRRAGAVAS